jgi:cobalt-zinc-cadmium efflux system outer membrane protein
VRLLAHSVLLALALSACATVSKERGHDDVARIVKERTGRATSWEQGTPEDDRVAGRVAELLRSGLHRQRAIEIALVNNPSLQATYEELGVSQADMVQSGLLSNPSLHGSVAWPIAGEGARVEYEAAITQSFLDIFVLPLRKRVAQEQFMVDTLRVAQGALEVASEVSKVFAEVQAHTQLLVLRRVVLQAEQAASEVAGRQHRAGNITDLALETEQVSYQQARLDLAREELEAVKTREELNRLLGLWGPQTEWSIAEKLPDLPTQEAPLEHCEATAIRQRLDIDAARKQALLLSNAVGLARTPRLFGVIEVGVHVHQDPDGPRLFGPTLSLELPIFDRRQALIAKLEAQRRQAARRLDALSVDARSQVRIARARMIAARQVVEHHRVVLLPLREKVVEHAHLHYNGMQIGVTELLAAKRDQVEGHRAYVESVRDYWVARAELERVMGGSIGTPAPPSERGEDRVSKEDLGHEHSSK